MAVQFTSALIDQIIKGRCSEFADLMGMHKAEAGQLQVNVFLPGATAVEVLNGTGKKLLGTLSCLHKEGLFSALIPGRKLQAYRLRVFSGDTTRVLHDPYCFGRSLDAAEVQLFAEGRLDQAWQLLGAQPRTLDDCDGVHFVLWAPDVRRA
jgi:1,4-alpha-glucan branching enzyme